MNAGKISAIMTLLLSFFILPDCVQAKYSGGSGSADDPYKIATASDLLTLSADTNDYNATFVLTADIDLRPRGTFTTAVIAPDTNNSNGAFDGVFDGNNHTISNLTIKASEVGKGYLGLFGSNSGEIKNLRLKNIRITGRNESYYIGGLVGWNDGNISNSYSTGNITSGTDSSDAGGLVGWNDGNISNCFSMGAVIGGKISVDLGGLVGGNIGNISNCYSTGAVTGGDESEVLGGLVGFNGASISNCYSTGTVTGGDNSADLSGLAGQNGKYGIISNSYSTGNITGGTDSSAAGGLVGSNAGSISNSYSTGTVTGGDNSTDLSGLAGQNSKYGIISNCFSMGAVIGGKISQGLGGLVALNNGNISNCFSTSTVTGGYQSAELGGLVGQNNKGNINNCYSTGTVRSGKNSFYIGGLVGYSSLDISDISNCYSTGAVISGKDSFYIGGLVGYKSGSSSISNCYFLGYSGPDNGYGEPLDNAEMKQQASFVGWDFENIWSITEDASYPKLACQSLLITQVKVIKCNVTAGSKKNSDKISFSGTMDATADDFTDTIKIIIDSNDIVKPCDQNFPVNGKNGKYNYSGTEGGVRKSFTYDVKTRKFAFSASNIDLSGLDCPVTIEIRVGDYFGTAQMDETIVNGPKVPIPIQLMTAVKNVLRVDKYQVKHGKDPNSDQLSASGAFTVANPDPNMANWITEDLVITLGSQTFTIPADKLKPGKDKFSCTKADVHEDDSIATATFNFKLCSFTLTIKNTNIPTGLGDVDFGVSFAGFDETVQVTLP